MKTVDTVNISGSPMMTYLKSQRVADAKKKWAERAKRQRDLKAKLRATVS